MSDRKLRSGTRKDYNKMIESVDVALQSSADEDKENSDVDPYACAAASVKNVNKQHGEDGGEILNYEVNIGNSYDTDNEFESSESDEELRDAELKLEAMRKEQKILFKQSKRARIAQETAEIQKSLLKLQKNAVGKSVKKRVTAKSLRSMDDVVEQVDLLMDKNMRIKTVERSSSDSETDCVSRRSISSSGRKTSSKKSSSEHSKAKERLVEKKSGKSKNSLTSDYKFPQKWPHSFLNPHFVHSKEKNYEDLTISEFCAGYLTIIENESEEKREHRIAHLKELMYLSTRFTWKCVLDYHGACLLEIERGHLKWGDSFQLLQSTTLAGGFLVPNNRRGSGGGSQSPTTGNNSFRHEGTVFCKGYQKGTCQQTRDHYGQFYGESRLLKHICAKCWLKTRSQVAHPETSDDCPLKD